MQSANNWIDRYGKWVSGKYTKWGILFSWLIIAIVLNLIFPTANSQENNSAVQLDDTKPSVQAEKIVKEQFSNEQGIPALVVLQRKSGMTDQDLILIQKIVSELSSKPLENQQFIPPYHQMPPVALKTATF
jgi:RND superfamily putative drug exporter